MDHKPRSGSANIGTIGAASHPATPDDGGEMDTRRCNALLRPLRGEVRLYNCELAPHHAGYHRSGTLQWSRTVPETVASTATHADPEFDALLGWVSEYVTDLHFAALCARVVEKADAFEGAFAEERRKFQQETVRTDAYARLLHRFVTDATALLATPINAPPPEPPAVLDEGGLLVLDALKDALGGWRYIRHIHGDLYGVGWERVEAKLQRAIAVQSAALSRPDRDGEACNCEEWRENIPKVEAPRMLMHARNPGTADYKGVPFRYCPWCSLPKPQPSPGGTDG